MRIVAIVVAAVLGGAGNDGRAAGAVSPETVPDEVMFNRDIRPILSNTCFKCHGPDVSNNRSDLRLDLFETATAQRKDSSGRVRTAIVPGNPGVSEVWRRINSSDPSVRMPPPDSVHQLSPRDRSLIGKWIEQGAEYERHWAYVPPVRRSAPTVRDPSAVRNPIDTFVLAELERRRYRLSPEADRRTLIRRVSLDLTGLPPTAGEADAFAADNRPDAYERLVDRLLASPRYGERMAVPWLDVVRFADTVGFHGDQRQNIFPYRDYVINAFNSNKPFDQFTLEQIAGDLLENPTQEQRVATGFNRLNMMTREGGAQPKEYLAMYGADRVRAVSTTWMGSTFGCAECHDHKYDPFTTRDFYSFAAYFADIKEWGVYNDYKYTPEPELMGFNNDYPFPPEIEVESDYLRRRASRLRAEWRAHVTQVARAMLADADASAAVRAWAVQVASRLQADPAGWASAMAVAVQAGSGALAAIQPGGTVRFSDNEGSEVRKVDRPEEDDSPTPPDRREIHTIVLDAPPGPVAALRFEALPDELHGGRVSRGKDPYFNVKLALAVRRGDEAKARPLAIADAYPEQETETYVNGYAVATVRSRWRSSRRLDREPQAAVYYLLEPVVLEEGERLEATLTSSSVNIVRLSVSPLGARPAGEQRPAEAAEAFLAEEPDPAQRDLAAIEYFLGMGAPDPRAFATAFEQVREIAECREGRAFTMVTVAVEPRITRVLPRGNWQDESGEIVTPAPPAFLTAAQGDGAISASRQTRTDLARWLTARDNPLTARTFVNRLWAQFFGAGLSTVVDDLGMQGEYPQHPELLDWLAVEFMESGWDVKAMVRLMVTSATYRQAARHREDLVEIDPRNRLLARQSPRRLEAEFVRDNALFAAGLLDAEIGGPSGLPYQPDGYYAQLKFPERDYAAHTDDRQYRRGVYVHWQRAFLHPMLANFDAPNRDDCVAARNVSSTPQQALVLLNDPTFVEAARVLAERVIAEKPGADFAARLDYAFRRLLARPPRQREAVSLKTFYEARLAEFRERIDDAGKFTSVGLSPVSAEFDRAELAAWASVARVLLNLNETIVRY